MDLWAIFIIGLTVGGLTCLAVQGGLLASLIAVREESDLDERKKGKHDLKPTLAFLASKLVAYTLLGFLLGLFGQTLQISDSVRVITQILAGVYMLAVAMNLLDIHPVFRYAIIQPPRFLAKLVRNQAKNKDFFAPVLLGAMTIFIPCGTTLAIEAFAISTGKPVLGALTMSAFTIGTIPLFLGIGYVTTKLGDSFKRQFFKYAALGLIYLGILTINASLVLMDSPLAIQNLIASFPIQIEIGNPEANNSSLNVAKVVGGVQNFDINVKPNGYSPNTIQIKAGIPVKLNLKTNGNYACTSIFKIPQLGITKELPPTGTSTVEFTAQNPGRLTWTCSMGMYRGVIDVEI